MELLDILDEKGNKIGIKERDEVHKDGDWHKVAFIFVVNDKGEIILQKRSKDKGSNPNKWTASASGHLAVGDTNIQGARRELEEEIGITVKEDELEYLCTVKEQWCDEKRKISHIAIVYLLFKNVTIGELTLQEEEVKYVNYKDFEKMVQEKNEDIVKHDEIYAEVLKALHKKFDLS